VTGSDPIESGGLFVGRRGGPVRFLRPDRLTPRRRLADNLLADSLLAIELLLCLSLLGPQPLAWLWIGSQMQYQADNPTAGVATSMVGSLVSVLITAALAKRVDHGWKLVRRAAGHNQERGAVERMFVVAVIVALIIFGFWFLILTGPGPSVAPRG
jgi:hypothetical protein